jgi:hypothetical protein
MGRGQKIWGDVEEGSLEKSMETRQEDHEYTLRKNFPE